MLGALHLTRKLYYIMGWDYEPQADETQKRLKHLLMAQVRLSRVKLKSKKYRKRVRFKLRKNKKCNIYAL